MGSPFKGSPAPPSSYSKEKHTNYLMHARLSLIMPVVDFNHSDLLSNPHLFKGKGSKVYNIDWGRFSPSMSWP